jgi:CRP/FNR family transcriptional regulator, cyclic AMP receptor protein
MSEEPAIIGAQPLLRGLPADQIARLAAMARHVSYPARHRLFDEGAPADRFWIIDAGEAALDVLVPGAGRLIIETLGRGDAVGLSWLVPPCQWKFGAVCTQPMQAFEFDARAVRAACNEDPALGYSVTTRFMSVAAHRLNATRARLLQARPAVTSAATA